MSIPTNKTLYNKVKKEADKKYDKPSAYKSGWIVKEYKERGGEYSGKKKEKEGLSRWYKEEWKDIGDKEYPVYRPTKRITKDTPLTESEISPTQLKKQIKRKQKIKGDANLPAFEKKGGNKISTSTIMGDIDFDNMNWGSFKKQFQASKKKLGVSSLEDFANHILDNPKGFRDTTKKRANFYKNVILKKGKGNPFSKVKPEKPEPEPRTPKVAEEMLKEMDMEDRENYLVPPRRKPRPKYRRNRDGNMRPIGGSNPSEERLVDEMIDLINADEPALTDQQRENAELIRNMPPQPNRFTLPTLRPPHITEERIMNTPVVRHEYIPELEETSDLVKRYKEVQQEEKKERDKKRRKKGGMMQVSDDEADLLPEDTLEEVINVLQFDNSNPHTHAALMAILPQHGQAADRARLRASLAHYGYVGQDAADIMNAYNNLYNNFHTPQGSDDESDDESSTASVPMVSDDEMGGGGKKKKVVKVQKNKITNTFKNPNSIMEISKRMLRERDAGERDANLNTIRRVERSKGMYAPHGEGSSTIVDEVSEGGRHIRSHTVRPFFAMN